MSKLKSTGKCNLCGKVFGKAAMTRHLLACGQPEVAGASPAAGKQPPAPSFHIFVEGRYAKSYWMHVALPSTAPLSKLDDFLRDTWLECCGHMSAFAIGGVRYASSPMDIGFGEKERGMGARLGQALEVGMKFAYEYDFGSTTELVFKVVALREQAPRKTAVQILARNEAPAFICCQCGSQPATQVCSQCSWDGEGWLCKACAAEHECGEEMCLPIVNSPRVGVCAYVG